MLLALYLSPIHLCLKAQCLLCAVRLQGEGTSGQTKLVQCHHVGYCGGCGEGREVLVTSLTHPTHAHNRQTFYAHTGDEEVTHHCPLLSQLCGLFDRAGGKSSTADGAHVCVCSCVCMCVCMCEVLTGCVCVCVCEVLTGCVCVCVRCSLVRSRPACCPLPSSVP